MRYNIVLLDNPDLILASCPTMELARKYLKEMMETNKKLQKYYNWAKLPEYKIIEQEVI